MDSRERVLTALNFKPPDRVPVDFAGHRSSGIMAMAYARLRDYLGLPKRPLRIQDMILQLAVIDDDVRDRFGVDTVDVGAGFALSDSDWKPWVLPDGRDCLIPRCVELERDGDTWYLLAEDGMRIGVQRPGMVYFEQTGYPLQAALETGDFSAVDHLREVMAHDVWSSIPAPPGPVAQDEDGCRFLAEGARRLRQATDRFTIASVRGPLLEGGQHLFGMEGFSVLLASEPELVHHFLDNLTEFYLERIDFTLNAIGPYIDMVICFDDFGMQTGLMISPKMYREFFKPRQRILWNRVKELSPDVKILLHSCGSMAPIVPDLVEAGLDAWNPVQISARNMEPERLKADLGGKISFWGGGCDTQQVLRAGTPDEIRAHVRHNLNAFTGDNSSGGYVFTQVHNIMADVTPERITAMFDAVAEWNRAHQV